MDRHKFTATTGSSIFTAGHSLHTLDWLHDEAALAIVATAATAAIVQFCNRAILQSVQSMQSGTRSSWRSCVRHLHALTCWRSLSAQSLHDAIVGLHRRPAGHSLNFDKMQLKINC